MAQYNLITDATSPTTSSAQSLTKAATVVIRVTGGEAQVRLSVVEPQSGAPVPFEDFSGAGGVASLAPGPKDVVVEVVSVRGPSPTINATILE